MIDKGQGKPYYEAGRTAAGRVVNYFNPGDAALNGWEFNQLTKPDFLGGDTWRYSNTMYDCYREAELSHPSHSTDLMLAKLACLEEHNESVVSRYQKGLQVLKWNENRGFWLGDNPEILAHIIPARTHALGQKPVSGSLIEGNNELDYGNSNQGHSAQFYSTFAERQHYWRDLLRHSLVFKDRKGSESDGSVYKYSGLYREIKKDEGQ